MLWQLFCKEIGYFSSLVAVLILLPFVCYVLQINPLKCASSGMFVNLSAVMLKLCAPFLEDLKKMTLIDPNYILHSNRLDFQ
jgi:hypothetical protein